VAVYHFVFISIAQFIISLYSVTQLNDFNNGSIE